MLPKNFAHYFLLTKRATRNQKLLTARKAHMYLGMKLLNGQLVEISMDQTQQKQNSPMLIYLGMKLCKKHGNRS